MSMPVVVIGTGDHLEALRARLPAEGNTLTFRETETLQALETILERRPSLVVLERLFAATPRGAALINRIKADTSLAHVEIRVLAHDSDYSRVIAARVPVPMASPAPAPALDYRGTRRAPRFRMRSGVEVLVDGDPVTLVDLSTHGAQVLSGKTLRPDQRVRVAIGADREQHRVSASVAWAQFEMPPGRTHYRAGMAFLDADVARLETFCQRFRRVD